MLKMNVKKTRWSCTKMPVQRLRSWRLQRALRNISTDYRFTTFGFSINIFQNKWAYLVQDCVETSSLEFPIELGCEYEWAQLITAVNINWPEQIEANFGKAIGKILAQDRATAMSLLSSLEWKNIVCASLWLDLTRQQSRLCRLRIFYCSSVNMNAERGAWKKFNFICKGGKGEKGLLERVAWYEA